MTRVELRCGDVSELADVDGVEQFVAKDAGEKKRDAAAERYYYY